MTVFETTPEQQDKLLTDGFVLLPNALEPDRLARWRQIAAQLEADAIDSYVNGTPLQTACVIEGSGGPRVMRFDDVLGTQGDAALDLLACPAMMAVAIELCGPGVVPLQLDILYKHPDLPSVIKWHQGAPHPRGYPYLNVGIYLDDADADDGCLRYVPGTQHELQDICGLSEANGWEIPGVVVQPAKAGDILVQDMMILHGSPLKRNDGVRRTIYVELRPAAGIVESEVQSQEWAELRQRWMGIVVRRADPLAWPTEWRADLPSDLATDEEEIASIIAQHEPPIPAVYCHKSIETADYPIPADMRDGLPRIASL